MTFELPLANGHLLNLQPRSRRDKDTMLNSDASDIRNGAVEIGTRSEKNDSDADTPESPHQPKPTRLPVLKVFTDHSTTSPKNKVQGASHGSPQYDSPKSTDEERERYWRRIRDRLDRDSPPTRSKEKQKSSHNGAYRKIMSLASSPRQEIAKHRLKYAGGSPNEKTSASEANPVARTLYSSPGKRDGSEESTPSAESRFSNVKARMNSNHSASSSGTASSGRNYKSGSTTNSSYNSNSSVSPVSGPSSCMKEWEDKFVVHMPSAREPNPPTMNVQQISEYQQSIERVQNEGGSMVDPDTLPSPRTRTPEDHLNFSDGKRVGTLDGDTGPSYLPSHRRYYCPDEVGKQRFSTIWEESTNADGSFLGCKEINGPHDRNPDEILFFSTPERPKVVTISSRMPRLSGDLKPAPLRVKKSAGETTLHAQCSKSSPKALCRDAGCQQTKTKKFASLEAKQDQESTEKQTEPSANIKSDPREDDVFIITPTITRHLHRQPAVREPTARSAGEIITDARTKLPINTKAGVSPSGLRRVSQNSWGKSNAPSAAALDPAPATNITIVKTRPDPKTTSTEKGVVEKPRGMRGYIRTPGIPRSSTESRIDTPDKPSPSARVSSLPLRRTTPVSPETRNRSPTKTATPPATKSPSRIRGTMQAKIVDVAELDGHQVDEHRENDVSRQNSSSSHDQQHSDIKSDEKEYMSSETLHMIIDMVFLFVAQVQGFCRQIRTNRGSKIVLLKLFLNGILGMLEHCLHVLRKGLAVLSTYNKTGSWPKDKDLSWSLSEFAQALVYILVLGFVAILFARAVGVVILLGTWIMWLGRPFAVAFRTVTRVLSL
ncbi:hypothetical protein BJY04DRAFT_232772 [Aspergillus karnatakaensis]|uniref:putative NTP binding protein n=1 Tax=Aspergillus karnatakaensis TaxID=1810916 RepID=UPI003CCE029A